MPDCTFTEEELAAIEASGKWSQFQQSELLAVMLIAVMTNAGFEIGEGCEFSQDELDLIEDAKRWVSASGGSNELLRAALLVLLRELEPGPTNTVAPLLSIDGDGEIGDELSWTDGTWSSEGTISDYSYSLRLNGVEIDNGDPPYEIGIGEQGTYQVVVTATDEFGTRSRSSNSIVVAFTPVEITPAVIALDDEDPFKPYLVSAASFSYAASTSIQWYRNDVLVSGQTSAVYSGDAENGDTFILKTTAVNGAKSLVSDSNEETYSDGSAAVMPSGALGIWYADEYSTSPRKNIPNEITIGTTAVPDFLNQWRSGDRISAAYWSLTGITLTQGQTDPRGGTTAVRMVGTGGSWDAFNLSPLILFPAGTFTVVLTCRSNTGLSQSWKQALDFSTGTTVTVPATGFVRLAATATLGAGNNNGIRMTPEAGADIDIIIDSWEIFAGAADPHAAGEAPPFGGHILLGTTAYEKAPSISGAELDISVANSFGQAILDDRLSLTSFTAFACVKKVGTTPSTFNGVMSSTTANSYGDLGLFADAYKGSAFIFKGYGMLGYRQPFAPGVIDLLDLLDWDYNVLVWKYDAATDTGTFWVNDVIIASQVSDRSALADFHGLFLNDPTGERSSCKWTAGAFYDSALSRADIEDAVAVLRARAVANSLTVGECDRFLFFEGDSNTDGSAGSAPGGESYPFLFVPNAADPFMGSTFAQNGGKLADMVARAPLLDAVIPTTPGSRKFILSAMIGTNDGSLVFTSPAATYAADLLAYWADRKAAGFLTVGIGILNRKDANAAVGFNAWRTTINDALRDAVGTELDAFVDLDDDPNIGDVDAPDNTTYFQTDKVHLTTGTGTTGQAALEVLYRAVINAL